MIETERLRLRPWRPEDLDPFAAMSADPEVMRHFPELLAREEAAAHIAGLVAAAASDGFGFMPVEERARGAFLGMAGLKHVGFAAPFAPAVEIGWRLARDAWGKGYATEAACAWLDYGLGALGLAEIVAFTVPANRRSRAVMERLGMVRNAEDDFDHPCLPPGHPLRPHVLYRIGRDQRRSVTK